MAQAWKKYAPDSATPAVAKPLEYDLLVQESIPLYKALITTASGGTQVLLPQDVRDVLDTAANYGVSLTKQTFDPDGGELYISDKATTGFKVKNSGSAYGESVLVIVWWLPS